MRITVKEISDRLWSSVDRVCKHLLPNGKKELKSVVNLGNIILNKWRVNYD